MDPQPTWTNHVLLLLCLIANSARLPGQVERQPYSDYFEKVLENVEETTDIDGDDIADRVAILLTHPIDLNSKEVEELSTLGLLNDHHIFAIYSHIAAVGPLISVYELQSIPGFDTDLIDILLPLVRVGTELKELRRPLRKLLFDGENQITMRFGRLLQRQRGFLETQGTHRVYTGDANRIYLRFRHQYSNRLSYGISMEKDPGEEFFSGSNKHGFDFYSAHFFLQGYRRWLPRFALGDYNINLGQGLILHSGYGVGKSALVTRIIKGGYTIRPFASSNETNFLRGLAATITPIEKLYLTIFISSRNRDANILVDSSETGQLSFTSLQLSGLHRTASEIQDEKQIRHFTCGASFEYRSGKVNIGMNGMYQNLQGELQRSSKPYNQFRFHGQRLFNGSIHYTYFLRSVHFFGETAFSQNGAIASVNGCIFSPDPKIDVALFGRFLPRNFQTLTASPFAETSTGENEKGMYFGVEVRPSYHWTISGFADIWRHPWLRFNNNAPGIGEEYLMRITYRQKRKMELYLQYRFEQKEENLTSGPQERSVIGKRLKHQMRLNSGIQLSKSLELRNRVEFRAFSRSGSHDSKGFMLSQDIIYKPIGGRLSLTSRVALFDTDSYDAAVYSYENDLINQFAIPAYAYRGLRTYVNLRYRGLRNLTIEFRIAHTRYTDRDEIGSGHDLIDGNNRTDIKTQVIWKF